MKKQTRYVDIEFRSMNESEEESRVVAGVAAVFNRETDMGWYIEKIDSHAFDGADLSDVVLNFNHDMNYVLAGTRNSSLDLSVNENGLVMDRADIIDTVQGNDVLKLVRSGLINKMSFCFTVDEDKWEERDGIDYRTITKLGKIFDVSLVTFPAYSQTFAGIRSKDELDELAKKHFIKKEQDKRMEELLNGKDFI